MNVPFVKTAMPFILILLVFIAGCLSLGRQGFAPARKVGYLESHSPAWLARLPESGDVQYFVGKSIRSTSERNARRLAEADGREQCVVFIAQEAGAKTLTIKGLRTQEYYTETFLDDSGREVFVVHALLGIDKKIIQSLIEQKRAEAKQPEEEK